MRCGHEAQTPIYQTAAGPVCDGCWSLAENIELGWELIAGLEAAYERELDRFVPGWQEFDKARYYAATRILERSSPRAAELAELIADLCASTDEDEAELAQLEAAP